MSKAQKRNSKMKVSLAMLNTPLFQDLTSERHYLAEMFN